MVVLSPSPPSFPPNVGCYDSTIHRCDCNSSPSQCSSSGGVWTSGCNSCLVVNPPSPPSQPATVDDHGCYDVAITHTCDCSVAQSACTPSVGIWTSGCGCDNSGDSNSAADPDDHGCYNIGGTHQCDCNHNATSCAAESGALAYALAPSHTYLHVLQMRIAWILSVSLVPTCNYPTTRFLDFGLRMRSPGAPSAQPVATTAPKCGHRHRRLSCRMPRVQLQRHLRIQ